MRNRLFMLVCMLFVLVAASAQNLLLEDESDVETIDVVGYFCKGDTMTYKKTYSKLKVVQNDTTITDAYEEVFMIVVTDSTDSGYRMKMIPVSFDYNEESDSIHRIMQTKLSELTQNIVCEFTTDEFGSLKSIVNWRDIRDQMKIAIKGMYDSLYGTIPGLDTIMPRKQVENLMLLQYSTEQGIKSAYDELDNLFGLHGTPIPIGENETDSEENGYPQHITLKAGYTPIEDETCDSEDDYAVMTMAVTTIPAEDAVNLGFGTLGLIMTDAANDSLNSVRDMVADSLTTALPDGVKVYVSEYYGYFYNGWPKECFYQKKIDLGARQSIESRVIEWVSCYMGARARSDQEELKPEI